MFVEGGEEYRGGGIQQPVGGGMRCGRVVLEPSYTRRVRSQEKVEGGRWERGGRRGGSQQKQVRLFR